MGLATGGKRRDLLVSDMNPLDLALAAERVGESIETVADDAIDPFDPGRDENLGKLIRHRLRHHPSPFSRAERKDWAEVAASDRCSHLFQVQHGGGVGTYASGQRGVLD
jgi:hypothetical protein